MRFEEQQTHSRLLPRCRSERPEKPHAGCRHPNPQWTKIVALRPEEHPPPPQAGHPHIPQAGHLHPQRSCSRLYFWLASACGLGTPGIDVSCRQHIGHVRLQCGNL
eukprot:2790511-Prymnesium_polylepis.1